MVHEGAPRSLQAIDTAHLVHLAKESGGVIQVLAAVGDTVLQSMPLLHVLGARTSIDERKLRNGIELGNERTFEQDPKYALRLLVDIAIKALSPAINDPTTAVQALDEIEDLLLRLGQRHLDIGAYRDSGGELRLVVPFPTWDDLLRLAFDEILFCGATSVQVMRRMNALVADLTRAVPEERRAAIAYWDARLKATIARSFADTEERLDASKEDRQGLGAPRQNSRVDVVGRAVYRAAPRCNYCAGMVIRGRCSGLPVSESVKKNMTAVSARLVCQSPLSIQNQ